jgi:glucokinase
MGAAIGVDVGGTKIAAAVVNVRDGTVARRVETPTLPGRGGAAVLADCAALVERLAAPVDSPVGVGLCELVGLDGTPQSAVTIDWRDLDIADAFGPRSAAVESDVRAAAIAEARFGAARSFSIVLYLSVGTGISFCLTIDGRPYRGAHGHAIQIGEDIEEHASGRGLALAAGRARAEEVLADPAARPVVERGARELGSRLAWLVGALDPHAVVVGGGLGLNAGYRELVERAARIEIPASLPIVPAGLGTEAGVIGAAMVVAPGSRCGAHSN